jgi:hypothetical protein
LSARRFDNEAEKKAIDEQAAASTPGQSVIDTSRPDTVRWSGV